MSVNGQNGWVSLPSMEEKLVTVSLSVLFLFILFPFLTVFSIPFVFLFYSNEGMVPAREESFRTEPYRDPSPYTENFSTREDQQ